VSNLFPFGYFVSNAFPIGHVPDPNWIRSYISWELKSNKISNWIFRVSNNFQSFPVGNLIGYIGLFLIGVVFSLTNALSVREVESKLSIYRHCFSFNFYC
jgi:hypothetical protein